MNGVEIFWVGYDFFLQSRKHFFSNRWFMGFKDRNKDFFVINRVNSCLLCILGVRSMLT